MLKAGSLTVVGTGIRFFSQITTESLGAIDQADFVFHLVDAPTAEWIERRRPTGSESLLTLYRENESRLHAYDRMVSKILARVRGGEKVCAAFYGHPGVLVSPSHQAIRQARAEGYPAVMLPAISTIDCLIADLGVDPRFGYQSFEATDFLIYRREFDRTASLLLWQIDSIGNPCYREAASGPNPGMAVLMDALLPEYGPDHRVILYRAPQLPLSEPMILAVPLKELSSIPISSATVLFIPPGQEPVADRNMMEALGLGGRS